MIRIPSLVDQRALLPAQTALALDLVSRLDLLRLKSLARLYARGLPAEMGWDDLLQEAITRVISGSRRQPGDVPTVAFLAGILKSLRSEYRRRAIRKAQNWDSPEYDRGSDSPTSPVLIDPAPGPERALLARQQLDAIRGLFADDEAALAIIAGLADGLSAEQIRAATGLSRTDYDSARKRMRRTLLRQGLTCETP